MFQNNKIIIQIAVHPEKMYLQNVYNIRMYLINLARYSKKIKKIHIFN